MRGKINARHNFLTLFCNNKGLLWSEECAVGPSFLDIPAGLVFLVFHQPQNGGPENVVVAKWSVSTDGRSRVEAKRCGGGAHVNRNFESECERFLISFNYPMAAAFLS